MCSCHSNTYYTHSNWKAVCNTGFDVFLLLSDTWFIEIEEIFFCKILVPNLILLYFFWPFLILLLLPRVFPKFSNFSIWKCQNSPSKTNPIQYGRMKGDNSFWNLTDASDLRWETLTTDCQGSNHIVWDAPNLLILHLQVHDRILLSTIFVWAV